MSDNNIPQTPEAVAYKLMQDILTSEGKFNINPASPSRNTMIVTITATRQEIFDTYKQCLLAVKS